MTLENTTAVDTPAETAIESQAPATLPVDTESTDATKATDADKAAKALQRRVDRLTREKYQLRAENEQLRAPPRQKEEGQPLTDDDVETRAQAIARERSELKEFNDRCNDVFDKGTKASKQFSDALKAVGEEIGSAFDEKGKPSSVMSAILDADEPHKLIIYLADKPELAAELADLTPSRQIRRVAQIEKEMSDAAKPQQSAAPKPVQPVRGAVGQGAEPDPKDTKRWIAWENEKLLASRQRK